jgi:hypothetical protein
MAAPTASGGMPGLSPSELESAYTAEPTNPWIATAPHFAQQLVQNQGHVSDEEVAMVRQAGYRDAAEIVGQVALNVFTSLSDYGPLTRRRL